MRASLFFNVSLSYVALLFSLLSGCGAPSVTQNLRDKPSPELRFDLVELFLYSKAYDVAAPIAQELYQRHPQDARPPLYLGVILRERKVFLESERYLIESIKRAPKSAVAYDALGVLYGMQSKLRKAITAHARAAELSPNVAKFWHNLGFARSMAREYEGAVSAYQRALSLAPEHHATYVNLGITYGVLGRYKEAREVLVQRLNPAEVSLNLGLIQERRGDLIAARNNLNHALKRRVEVKRARAALKRVTHQLKARQDHHDKDQGGVGGVDSAGSVAE